MTRHPLILATLCGLGAALPAAADDAAGSLRTAELGSTAQVHEFKRMWLAGQPSAADLVIARNSGIRAIINLRRVSEPAGFDEQAEAERLGFEYVSLPIGGPDELTDAVFDQARELLADTGRPLLLHCASGNRVGAVWLPWRVLDDGASLDVAVAEAREIGLSSPALEAKARDYIERRQTAD